MRRISSDMPNSDMNFYMRLQEERMSNIENQIGSQNRIHSLRDDPIAASHAVRYESYLARLNRFEANTKKAKEHLDNTHDYLYETTSIIQRVRELAVQGANGNYSPDDLKIMGMEVDTLLRELVKIANATGPDTRQMFSGDKVYTEPFRIVEGTIEGGEDTVIKRVEYRGSGPTRKVEIGDNMFLDIDLGGDQAFGAEKMHILSTTDATNYRVQEQGAFFIDGIEIPVNIGDTLPSIIAKINDSAAPVKAYVDPETRGLSIEGTSAHFIRMEDKVGGATVLRDLGMISGNLQNNAPNWSSSARVYGGSMFDMVIRLRDGLYRGDQDFVGSQGIGGIDLALNNVTMRLADVSARKERADFAWQRINAQIPNVTNMENRETGVDMADAAMYLNMAKYVQQASLQTAAKILPQTLLDFLR
jgi:flagellar hook-associated protein 3 FlgL